MITDWEDAMQAGVEGFIEALGRWDEKKGAFSTICWHYVRKQVQQMLMLDQPIKRPPYAGMPYKVFRQTELIELKHGRTATAEDLNNATEQQMKKWQDATFHFQPLLEQIKSDKYFDELDRPMRIAQIADTSPSAEEQLIQAEDDRLLDKAMNSLTVAEKDAFFGEHKGRLGAGVRDHIKAEAVARIKKKFYSEPEE